MYTQKIELHLIEENLKEGKLKKRDMKEEKSDEVLKPPRQTRSLASRPRADLGLSGPVWAYLIDVPSAKSARGLESDVSKIK